MEPRNPYGFITKLGNYVVKYAYAEVAPACAGRESVMKFGIYTVYVLRSEIENWFYVGMSEKPRKRLIEHNSGQVRSTKARKPFRIVFTKIFKNRIEARDFEKFLKIRSNKERLLKSL